MKKIKALLSGVSEKVGKLFTRIKKHRSKPRLRGFEKIYNDISMVDLEKYEITFKYEDTDKEIVIKSKK